MCSVLFQQDHEANHDPSQRTESKTGCAHRRYSGDSRVTETTKGPHPWIDLSVKKSRFHRAPREINHDHFSEDKVPENGGPITNDGASPPWGEIEEASHEGSE